MLSCPHQSSVWQSAGGSDRCDCQRKGKWSTLALQRCRKIRLHGAQAGAPARSRAFWRAPVAGVFSLAGALLGLQAPKEGGGGSVEVFVTTQVRMRPSTVDRSLWLELCCILARCGMLAERLHFRILLCSDQSCCPTESCQHSRILFLFFGTRGLCS